MRFGSFLLLVIFMAASSSARADVIFSGSVTSNSSGGPPCGRSEPGSSSISLACRSSNPTATATVTGSGDAFGGSIYADSLQISSEYSGQFAHSTAVGQLDLNETYVLIGGLGTGIVNFVITAPVPISPSSPEINCVFTFDGVSQSCVDDVMAGSGTISEQVEYWVPFSIQFEVMIPTVADTFDDDEQTGLVNYSFSEPGLIAIPTPEPSSIYLLVSGLAGVLLATKTRMKRA